MAKNSKANGKDHSQTIYQMPAEKTLKALLRQAKKAYAESQAIAGEQGAAISNAAEHHHLHKGAFGVTKRLDRMEDAKLAEFWAHLNDYFVKCGLQARIDNAPPLDIDEKEPSGKITDLSEARDARAE